MARHMTLSERSILERLLVQDFPFSYIAKRLNRSPSTISREVREHRFFTTSKDYHENDCALFGNCLRKQVCTDEPGYCYTTRCKFCKEVDCRTVCERYVSKSCPLLNKPPYVCSCCKNEKNCKKDRAYYSATRAHAAYEKQLRASRSGIRISPERLTEIGALIQPLIEKGQSLNQILVSHKSEIGLSEKTIYNYIDSNAFKIKNIDLPKKVAYRPRRTKPVLTKFEYHYREGRTYEDFKAYLEANPDTNIVEMDTVKSSRGSTKTLLTIIFRSSNMMLAFLMEHGSEECVLSVFDMLSKTLGLATFRELFPIILTDNGVEFKDPEQLEYNEFGARRTRIFYCDPQASWQKPHIEKNHVLLRRIIPKGTSFRMLTDEDVNLMLCHINSVPREIFGNKTPFQLFQGRKQKELLELLSLFPVAPDEVVMKPSLLNLKSR